ncbi:MAG TPA: ABC transporter permease [Paenibacillus sp.]|jgi:ABC-2 type transport system permease protein
MLNLIQADVYKLRKSASIKVIFAITTISAVLMAVIAYLIPHGKIEDNLSGLGFMFSDINVISILGAVTTAVLICGDFDTKTFHAAIANGSSRSSIIISKTTVFCLAILFVLLPYAIITGITLSTGSEFNMGSVAVGFLNMITTEAGRAFTASEIWKTVAVILTLAIVYIAQVSICIPLAFILRKPVLVVAIYYGFSILTAQLAKLSDSSKVFDRIFSCTPYGGNYTFITLATETGEIVKAITISLIFIIVMLGITYSTFRKSEIK